MKALLLSLEQAKALYEQGGAAKDLALKVYTEEELIKQGRPHSWEEFCENYPIQDSEYFITTNSDIVNYHESFSDFHRMADKDRNICISEQEAEAFLALMQLRQLRKAWVGDWKPDWSDLDQKKWCILLCDGGFYIEDCYNYGRRYLSPPENWRKSSSLVSGF